MYALGMTVCDIQGHCRSPGFLYWNDGNVTNNAETLLYELGHAYNFLKGSGGFAISNLAEIRHPNSFEKLIDTKCFPN
jgi:hypothetical protein